MRFLPRRRRLWLLAALLLAGAVALGCALALGPSSKLEANFEKLQVGMALRQVNEILASVNQRGSVGRLGRVIGPSRRVLVANFQKLRPGTPPEEADDVLRGTENQWDEKCPPFSVVFYQEQGGNLEVSVLFVEDKLTDKRLQRLPQTLGQFLRARLTKIRRQMRL